MDRIMLEKGNKRDHSWEKQNQEEMSNRGRVDQCKYRKNNDKRMSLSLSCPQENFTAVYNIIIFVFILHYGLLYDVVIQVHQFIPVKAEKAMKPWQLFGSYTSEKC